jgi:hypothetical protein
MSVDKETRMGSKLATGGGYLPSVTIRSSLPRTEMSSCVSTVLSAINL